MCQNYVSCRKIIHPLCDWCQYVRQTWQTTSWITLLYVYMYVTSSSFIGCKIRCSLSTQIWIDWNGLQHCTVVQVHNYTLAVPYFGIKMVIGVSRSVCQSLIHQIVWSENQRDHKLLISNKIWWSHSIIYTESDDVTVITHTLMILFTYVLQRSVIDACKSERGKWKCPYCPRSALMLFRGRIV